MGAYAPIIPIDSPYLSKLKLGVVQCPYNNYPYILSGGLFSYGKKESTQ